MDDASRLIDSATERLIAAGVRQRTALAKRLKTTTTDVLALHYVVTTAESAPADLARALLLSPSGATAVIDRLTSAQFVIRARGSGIQRVVLTATDAGRELHAQAFAPSRHGLRVLIEDLPRSERVVVEEFLTRLADLVEREADQLIALAEQDSSAAAGTAPPVLWS